MTDFEKSRDELADKQRYMDNQRQKSLGDKSNYDELKRGIQV